MNKTILFDESLFKVSSGKTRKKNPSSTGGEIRVRERKVKPETLKRKQFFKYLREKQEEKYKKLIDNDPHLNQSNDDFEKPFDETLQFLMNLAEKEASKQPPPQSHNHSVKRPVLQQPVNENVSLQMPNTFQDISSSIMPPVMSQPAMQLSTPVKNHNPSWGCLKNGNLPTFKNWKNQTQKIPPSLGNSLNKDPESVPLSSFPIAPTENIVLREIQEKRMQNTGEHDTVRLQYPKQKRTVRRTYKVGRCKTKPHVTVLVSNKTIRNRVTTESQLLKQMPIEEVRKYLVKKGFIKVGSSSPNDVLRKMFETAKMMCGEMENHNPDNLLYNYFHNQDESL